MPFSNWKEQSFRWERANFRNFQVEKELDEQKL